MITKDTLAASTSNADWVSSLESSTSFPPRCRAAENDQATGDRKIKWVLSDCCHLLTSSPGLQTTSDAAMGVVPSTSI
jgi:hypothetical protein